MAKTKEAEDEVEGQAIDAETSEMLENEVKKGKARKFILICKGAQIKKLIVFKKGPYNTRLQKAKKDGFRGEAVCGIVTGSGENLRFQLAGTKEVAGAMSVDAPVDAEPTKTTKLKEFLADHDLKRKPEYEIIRDVAALTKPDEGDDGAPVAAASAATAATAAPSAQPATSATGAAANGDLKAKCEKIKTAVIPRIKEAVAADPSKKEEIVRLLEAAGENEREGLFDDAFKSFVALTETVKVALGGKSEKEKYEAALPGADLKIKLLQSYPSNVDIKAEFDKLNGYLKKAKEHAQKNEHGDANKELAKLEKEYPSVKDLADTIGQQRKYEAGVHMRLANLKEHQGKDVMDAAKIKEIEDKLPDLDAAIKARDWAEARKIRVGADGKSGIVGTLDALKKQGNVHGDYVGLRNNALLSIQALEAHPNKAAITADIEKIKKDLIEKAKEEYETNKSFDKARALLVKVEPEYEKAKKKADTAGTAAFKKERDAAQAKLTDLDKAPKNTIVAAEITAIKAKLSKADGYAGTNQFPDASALVAEAVKDCEAAEKTAARQTAYNDAEKAAGTANGNIEKDRNAAVAATQKLLDQLKAHPQEAIVRFEIGEIQKKIDKAKVA